MNDGASGSLPDRGIDAFIGELLDRAATIRQPELFAGRHPEALLHVPNRQGVTVVALRTSSLTDAQLMAILRYRLVQYILANQLDPSKIYADRLQHEPRSNVSQGDVHLIAGSADSGEILCYMTLEAPPTIDQNVTLASGDRTPFPVETVFGVAVFNRLRILPDLPAMRIREIGRFAKNHQRPPLDELSVRGPVEALVACARLLTGALRSEVDACIGDLEEGVVKKNLDFLHLPTVVIHGVVPYAPEDSYGFHNYQHRARYPFAFLSSDFSLERLDAIEDALALPGGEAIMALLALKKMGTPARSSLLPSGGLPALDEAPVAQPGIPMSERRRWLDSGQWLRGTNLFHSLSVAESAVLGTFMEHCTAAAGDTIVRQGDTGDDLYLIESGEAEVQIANRGGDRVVVTTLGPGDCFGEIALVTGGERSADVVAIKPMILMRLTHDAYARYLAHLVDVDNQITHTALSRTRDTLRAVRGDDRGNR